LRTVALSVFMLAGWLIPASANVVYNGGAPDQGGQIYSSGAFFAAMSFMLTPGETTITGINWWGGCYPATTCGSSPLFGVGIATDNSGVPGMLLDSTSAGSANQTATGKLIGGASGWDEYSYSVSLGPWTNLTANTTYWLSIYENEPEPGGTWGWETTSSAPAGATLQELNFTAGVWNSLPEQLAFQLTGPGPVTSTPEPGFFGMIGGALGVLALLRRRATR
jgi:hypothetical protein